MKHTVSHAPFGYTELRHRGRLARRLGVLALLLGLASQVQAAVIFTVGVTGAYPTITAALAAVPTTLGQNYELRLLDASYLEDVLLTKTGSIANTLTIRPAAGVTTVLMGTFTFGAGSAYATLSGNNGTVARALTLRQPSLTVPAVAFRGDASHNMVREATVLGSNTVLTSGVVVVGDGNVAGNDYNTLTECFVGNADPAQLPANLVYAASASGVNDGFSLTNCELFNFDRTGVLVAAGNGNLWTISNNSFYYNAAALPTAAQTGIDFRPGMTANDAMVSANFIGGKAAGATGGTWTNGGSQNFRGIVMNCGTSTGYTNEVMNNVVREVSLTGTGSTAFTALNVAGSRSELTANTVTNVSNTGTSGVNSLVSQATTILSSFNVSNG